jgi:YVTN family beta-propeller protein
MTLTSTCVRSFSVTLVYLCLFLISPGLSGAINTTQAQTRAYVATGSSVTVIDTDTSTVVDTIPVCTDFTCSPIIPAVTPNGARVYVTNILQDTVSVIDTLTNTLVGTITVGQSPWGIAITPDGTRAYVANSSGTISVIDTSTDTVITTIVDNDLPFGVAITPDGTRVYVSNARGSVSVVDISTNTIISDIPVLDFPVPGFGFPARDLAGIAITPDGTRAYVVSHSTAKTYVISTITTAMTDTIHTEPGVPLSIAIHPDGTRAYTATIGGSFAHVSVIDTASNSISATIPAGGAPPFVGVTPDGARLYVDGAMAVTIIDTATNTIVTQIPIGQPMGGVAFGTLPPVPHSKDDCKNSGYQQFSVLGFRNQGQCVKYVNEHAK